MARTDTFARDPRRRWRAILLGLLALGLAAALGLYALRGRGPLRRARARLTRAIAEWRLREQCIDGPGAVRVCPASELARVTATSKVPHEAWLFDPARREIRLLAVRNEVVAFQLVLRPKAPGRIARVQLSLADLGGPAGARLAAAGNAHQYLAHYVTVDPGGYSWGPRSEVLPWPDRYPDALIPLKPECTLPARRGTRHANHRAAFALPADPGPSQNQTLWVDWYVPRDQAPGRYHGELLLDVDGQRTRLALALTVAPPVLPDRPSVMAVGEVYAPYEAEGVGRDLSTAAWQRMAQCYQQLAHRHRVVFVERLDDTTGFAGAHDELTADWTAYDQAFGPALSGALFARSQGYRGPGEETPLTIWRTPWVQRFNGHLAAPLAAARIARYEALARQFAAHADQRGWRDVAFFAYLFDELVGPLDAPGSSVEAGRLEGARSTAARLARDQFARVQQAIDAGAGRTRIPLLWTSHLDPAAWQGRAGLDLVGVVRLWAPNAAAANPSFLKQRRARGEQAWFYHAGHPSLGVHGINASGIELRTWGLITARYQLDGHLMWAVNLSDAKEPYRFPSYKRADDRFGNGTLVYPGHHLPDIGWPAVDEPVPSMRLKAWRAGLQDAELVALARRAAASDAVDGLLRALIPRALKEASGRPSWPSDSARWHEFRRQLIAQLAKGSGAARANSSQRHREPSAADSEQRR